MNRFSISAAVLCLGLAGPLRAQDRNAPPATRDPGRFARSVGLHYVDGQLWGGGSTFKVRFDPDRLTFTPALGSRAPHDYPLTLQVDSFGRGARRQPAGPGKLSAEALTARYERAGFTETYEIRCEGIEQSFVFDRLPPGNGDLVVTVRLQTEMQPDPAGDRDCGLRFSVEDLGGIAIGAVTGLDAGGRRIPGTMRYEEGLLEMRLPAAFVEQATLPLVLDPVIGARIGVHNTADENRAPDVAYDATNDLYLVVFERVYSATDTDIHGQRVNADGSLRGGLILIENGTTNDRRPAVANINLRDTFVVVYVQNDDIWARPVPAASGTPGFRNFVSVHPDVEHTPDVGGETNLVDDDVVCVWADLTSRVVKAAKVQVNAAGIMAVQAQTTLGVGYFPRISRSGGAPGRYLVGYNLSTTTRGADVGVSLIDRNLTHLAARVPLSPSPLDEYNEGVDGDGTNWIVAKGIRSGTTDSDVYASQVTYDPGTGSLHWLAPRLLAGQTGAWEIPTSVSWVSPGTCLVGWQRRIGSSADSNLYVTSVDLFTCGDCEGQLTVRDSGNTEVLLAMASALSGGGTAEDALLVWQESGTTFNGDINARRWTTEDGIHTDLGGGCGGGTARATCARLGNAGFYFRVRGAPASSTAWLLLGLTRLDLPCGSCTLVPDPWTGFVVPGANTNTLGWTARRIPIPNAPVLAGTRFYGQWLLPGTGCTTFNTDLSNALQVQIQ